MICPLFRKACLAIGRGGVGGFERVGIVLKRKFL